MESRKGYSYTFSYLDSSLILFQAVLQKVSFQMFILIFPSAISYMKENNSREKSECSSEENSTA